MAAFPPSLATARAARSAGALRGQGGPDVLERRGGEGAARGWRRGPRAPVSSDHGGKKNAADSALTFDGNGGV
jgi:hypothetical protein